MANSKTSAAKKRAASPKSSAKKSVEPTASASSDVTLGKAVQIYVKSSSHAISLVDPKLVKVGELSFIEGTQVTGKVGHRFEGKRTLVACDNVASLIEFASEDDIWSEPQSKLLRHTRNDEDTSPVLTLHEQGQSAVPRHGSNFNGARPRFDYQSRDGQHRGRQNHGNHRHQGRNRDNRE